MEQRLVKVPSHAVKSLCLEAIKSDCDMKAHGIY